ncbi:MAG: hypothetical protein C0478_09585 [Planctomyces sp.]|nr:hypothetical protein [Planctomyces sp.]
MGTLDEIQRLNDGQFHRLGDDLLRRVESRYRRLRTHGLNDRGESIKGQPDSYVGETAATCSVAVCYTVQRSGWWNKAVQDVLEAVAASPMATEVVVVIPHNADRDGPKDKTIDWLSEARVAAGKATLRVIDGREISQLLDTDHQDLRHNHLGIPYSRLSGSSILASCRMASLATIDSIRGSGRYDPERYSHRSADKELYRVWQSAYRYNDSSDRRVAPIRLIALVNDSGVGKTSLVCEFTRTLGAVLPVLLIQARNLMFGTEDGLVAAVIHKIQGFLDPSARVIEEAALSKLLSGSVPLTVVLDGLDEAHNPEAVRKAITCWLSSKLCQVGILIVTSRREFWQTCVDSSWVKWVPNPTPDDRSPVKVADRSQVEKCEPAAGLPLPDRFNEGELEAAWLRAGRTRSELAILPDDAREELRHPFTLRVFLDLQMREGHSPKKVTRAALLERWLNHRLDAESLPSERITRSHFQQSLRMVASRIAETSDCSVSVDELTEVPRFDSSHPPGPVLQRMIEAGILESLPNQTDRIRFAVEAVQDFYRAEADVEDIKSNPAHMAEAFLHLPFTTAYSRLVRIGARLIGEDVRHEFIQRLLEASPIKAAIVVRAHPDCYTAEARARIAGELGTQITDRYRVRAAMAITLLGELNCQEAIDVLGKHLLPPADLHNDLKSLGATAFTKLSYAPAAAFVYRWQWFGTSQGNDSYYFKDLLASIRDATFEFRLALADQSVSQLSNATGTKEHVKAVTVLAYRGDGRLVDHLASRLTQNGLLEHYENHALIALGSDAAGRLFAQSVKAIGDRLAPLPDDHANNDARNKLIRQAHFLNYDVRYLLASAFEPHVQRLIEDANPDISWIAVDLSKRAHAVSLLYPAAVAASKRSDQIELDRGEERSCVSADVWLGWWRQSTDVAIRRKLLRLLPPYPNSEIEKVLVDCLDLPELCASAATRLGEYGAIRSAPRLREILSEAVTTDDQWAKSAAAHALGDLRDGAAVPLLEKLATEHSDEWVGLQAIASLGLIGNSEAETALGRLHQLQKGDGIEDHIFEALLCCGSPTAVAEVIKHASSRLDGSEWLCERLGRLSWMRGWRCGEYYTHIYTAELVDYLKSHCKLGSPEKNWDIGDAFRQIDSPEVRTLLQKWGNRRGSPEDAVVRESDQRRLSDMCYWELRNRGDTSAISYTLDECADDRDDIYVARAALLLQTFPTAAVANQLRSRLNVATTISETLRMLALLGRFGQQADAELAAKFVNYANGLVANVACETMLPLSDPLLVPGRWREM